MKNLDHNKKQEALNDLGAIYENIYEVASNIFHFSDSGESEKIFVILNEAQQKIKEARAYMIENA